MHLVVVDPRLLVGAFEHPAARAAKLVSLLIYGQACLQASAGQHLEEAADLEDRYLEAQTEAQMARVREFQERSREEAEARRVELQNAFEQIPPDDLLLVSSAPLKHELVKLARACQGRSNAHVRPDLVVRNVATMTAKYVFDLPPAPFYLADRRSSREYLIHTAVHGEARSLVTDDADLLLAGDLAHSDPRTRRAVRPYELNDFLEAVLHFAFDLDAVDAPAVLRIAARHRARQAS